MDLESQNLNDYLTSDLIVDWKAPQVLDKAHAGKPGKGYPSSVTGREIELNQTHFGKHCL